MGVYSTNRTHLGNYSSESIPANENYVGGVGALIMTLENYQNDQAIFEAVLGMDFQEVACMNEGVEYEVFTEASASGFIDKIKEFVKKAWAKIKGLFETFLAKFDGVVMKDNKAFVEKYKRSVLSKDLSRMKYKWSELKKSDLKIDDLSSYGDVCDKIMGKDEKELEKISDSLNDGEVLESLLSNFAGTSTDAKSFKKDLHEKFFDDEDIEEGLTSSRLSSIIGVLSDKKLISDIEKSRKEVDKYFTKLLSAIEKTNKEVQKSVGVDGDIKKTNIGDSGYTVNYGGKGDSNKSELVVNQLNVLHRYISTIQTGVNMYTGGILDATKFHVKQCRRVFAQAVSFNPKAVKENAILIEAVGEAAEYEIMSTFEDYSMN